MIDVNFHCQSRSKIKVQSLQLFRGKKRLSVLCSLILSFCFFFILAQTYSPLSVIPTTCAKLQRILSKGRIFMKLIIKRHTVILPDLQFSLIIYAQTRHMACCREHPILLSTQTHSLRRLRIYQTVVAYVVVSDEIGGCVRWWGKT